MLIRLRIPYHLKLEPVFIWTHENGIPVVLREKVLYDSFVDELKVVLGHEVETGLFKEKNGDIISRRHYTLRRRKLTPMPYEVKRSVGLSRFQLLARPQDAALIAVRFGLTSDVD